MQFFSEIFSHVAQYALLSEHPILLTEYVPKALLFAYIRNSIYACHTYLADKHEYSDNTGALTRESRRYLCYQARKFLGSPGL